MLSPRCARGLEPSPRSPEKWVRTHCLLPSCIVCHPAMLWAASTTTPIHGHPLSTHACVPPTYTNPPKSPSLHRRSVCAAKSSIVETCLAVCGAAIFLLENDSSGLSKAKIFSGAPPPTPQIQDPSLDAPPRHPGPPVTPPSVWCGQYASQTANLRRKRPATRAERARYARVGPRVRS